VVPSVERGIADWIAGAVYRHVNTLGDRRAQDLDDRPGSDLDPGVIAHEPLDPPEDARGEHHLVPDGDLLAQLHLALAPLTLGPDEEHVADSEQQDEEDQGERAARLLRCSSQNRTCDGSQTVHA